jgi:bacterioferritin
VTGKGDTRHLQGLIHQKDSEAPLTCAIILKVLAARSNSRNLRSHFQRRFSMPQLKAAQHPVRSPEVLLSVTNAKLLDLLNRAIAGELQAAIQYMWQHVQWKGIEHYAVSDEFKDIAIGEMKHAEKIAERLWYLGGKPTTQPNPIFVGDKLEEMINFDIKAELEAITLYKEIMEQAQKDGDVATKEIFEEIEEEEEDHHDFFTSLLEK